MTVHEESAVLSVKDLSVVYGSGRRAYQALRGVSLEVARGETLGLVGESGSGKTTIGRAVLGLAPITSGQIEVSGYRVGARSARRRRERARHAQVVFQDPYGSLSPALSVGDVLAEPLVANGRSRTDAMARVRELLDAVQLPSDSAERLAREFSGGQRQRIAIARALALEPDLIICDEPVSALDLTTQRVVLDLLVDIQDRTGVGYLFISHDLAVVRAISHRVAVLHQGVIVETGDADEVTSAPKHSYTRRLLLASPVADPRRQAKRREARLKSTSSEVG